MVSTREMKKFAWELLQQYLRHRQFKGSGVYLDNAHRYWLLTPPFSP